MSIIIPSAPAQPIEELGVALAYKNYEKLHTQENGIQTNWVLNTLLQTNRTKHYYICIASWITVACQTGSCEDCFINLHNCIGAYLI